VLHYLNSKIKNKRELKSRSDFTSHHMEKTDAGLVASESEK